jgi:AcrR family transcriptional regulator
MPVAATPATRRATILATAAGLFAQHGFHGVSIDDLGRALGVTGPALYRHFRNKESLLAEMLLDISQRLLSEGRRRVALAADPPGALSALLHWHIEFALAEPALITVHERELDNVPASQRREIRRLQRSYTEEWVQVLRQVHPAAAEERARAATHATFGLLNSTPRSMAGLERPAMAGLLYAMAGGALDGALAAPAGRAGVPPGAR